MQLPKNLPTNGWAFCTRDHATGKLDKAPRCPSSGGRISTAKPSQWAGLAVALQAVRHHAGATLSLRLNVQDLPIVAIDLDKCADDLTGEIEPWAQEFVGRAGTFTEFSASGRGLHILGLGSVPFDIGHQRIGEGGIEIYGGHSPRHIALTGDHLKGTPLELRQIPPALLGELVERYGRARPTKHPAGPPTLSEVGEAPALAFEALEGRVSPAALAFLTDGQAGGDRSAMVARCAVELWKTGEFPDGAALLNFVASNAHVFGVALDHRQQDAEKALSYLWTHHVQPAVARGPGATDADFERLAPEPPRVWPAPTPLPRALPPVASFSPELLPQALRSWVADIAHRMQCPVDFPAVAALVSLSGLVGARATIRPKAQDDWEVVPNLWGLVVGRPGVMKSPALSQGKAPLVRLEAQERERFEAELRAWEIENRVRALAAESHEKDAKKLAVRDPAKARELLTLAADTPAAPAMRRFIVNDSSVEKLGVLLTTNPWGLLVYGDELHGLLCSLDKPGQEGSRGFYLTGYDGNQGHAVDRIGRGESFIPRVCLAMLGGIQPARLQNYVRDAVSGGAGDDGLLQRFGLAVWPDVSPDYTYVDQWPDTEAKQAAYAVYERLAALQPVGDNTPQQWRFSNAAQGLYAQWATAFEIEIRGDELHPAVVSHLGKYRKLIPALALLFALVDTPDNGGEVGEVELRRALDFGAYLRTHAERIYSAATTPDRHGATALLAKIKGGRLRGAGGEPCASFTPREVALKGWTGLGTPDDVRKAANMLAEHGFVEKRSTPTNDAQGRGRPSERYVLHPDLVKGGDDAVA